MPGGDAFWHPLPGTGGGGGGGGAMDLIHVRDEKASGTNGGGFTSGAWQTRTLNTVKTNGITGASLSTDKVTLPAGTYEAYGRAPAMRVNRHQSRLYNVTGAATLLVGVPAYENSGAFHVNSDSVLMGRFTLAVASEVRLEHRCETTQAIAGYGLEVSFGEVCIYAELMIWKVS